MAILILISACFIIIASLIGFVIVFARDKSDLAALQAVKRQVDTVKLISRVELYSRIWRGLALLLRCCLFAILIVYFWGFWYHAILGTLISLFLSWIVYDRIVNIIVFSKNDLKNNFWYIANKGLNKIIGRAYWAFSVVLIVAIVYWLIEGQKFFNN